ncbi:MAG: helix-turn-helix domain-containing protein [Spirochaetales bacterium]|nr:helix-turn-helix domain-containing protein [Spirochaetales bacterium]
MAKSGYCVARKTADATVGESVRIIRELQEMSQNELAGIPQSTISAVENGQVKPGIERAKALARALKVHPAVLVFPAGHRRVALTGRTITYRSRRQAPQACSVQRG